MGRVSSPRPTMIPAKADDDMGAPTKLTEETAKIILEVIGQGAYLRTACQAAGISEDSLILWRKKGEAGEEPYHGFSVALKQAEANNVTRRLARIEAAAIEGNWTADAWYLERRYPDEWGRRVQEQRHSGSIEVTGAREELARKLGAGAAAEAADSDPAEPE